jgi:hypothetical protein
MNLLQRINLCLLRLTVHKKQPLSRTQDSVATPLGHVPYRDTTTMHRHLNPHASLDEGVQRARNRRYAEGGKHDE